MPMIREKAEALEDSVGHVFPRHHDLHVLEERLHRMSIWPVALATTAPPSQPTRIAKVSQHRHCDPDGHDARQDKVVDRIDVHGAQGVDLLIDAHRTDFRCHGRTDATRDEDGHHDRGEFFGDGDTDEAADVIMQAAFDHRGEAVCNASTPPRKTTARRPSADWRCRFQKLLKDLAALAPSQRQQALHGAPKEQHHLTDVLEHDRKFSAFFSGR